MIESYLKNCWTWAAKKRPLFEEAELIVETLPAITYCEECEKTYSTIEYGKICPHCGKPTEVYSRITGYYRPVQNWNDGKLQEYANRTEYKLDSSVLKRPVSSVVTLSGYDQDVKVSVGTPENVKYLFTTKTCPNCKLAKEYLQGIAYVPIDAEENMELAVRYGVMQAPTLVVVNGDSHKKYVNASNIKKYVDQLTLVGVE